MTGSMQSPNTKRTMASRTLLALSLLPLFVSACDAIKSCTELGCDESDGYASFDLGEHYYDWDEEQDAEYTFTVTWGSGSASCATVVSGDVTCDSDLIALERSVDGMGDDEAYVIDAVLLTEFPGSTVLTIERDGALVVEQYFSVEASVDYPNGAECPPECRGWTGEVDGW